ncbi:serine/threonine-protein kinase [Kitasatospora sp. NPDC004745]|uniref:serine/threonine-protein kinase n=1 Tax=Kitasatospora sp. NPDC004745 TaxID=3364019 RepID=UPI0036C3D2EE
MTLVENDPREIGGYLLEGRLGAGGMGVVYRARSVSGRQVAVKVIRPELAADAEFRARFRQEVTAARKVSGAFTAPVLDADPDAPAPWLVTLFVPGPSLGERVSAEGPMSPPEVRRLAAGLAEALREIHRVGLVHRDLKPGNVLLAEDGPRVIDFGIARAADQTQLTSTGVAVGTPPFMAPEQFRSGAATAATDVFALGSVLAFAATGRGPFGADSSHAVGFRVVYEEPDLAGAAAELRPLILACLAKDPEQRPTVDGLLALVAAGARERTVQLRTGPVAPAPASASALAPAPPLPPPAPPTPTAQATVVPGPVVPGGAAHPSSSPAAVVVAPRPGRRKALLIGSALAAVVVATAGTLGVLAWQAQRADDGRNGAAATGGATSGDVKTGDVKPSSASPGAGAGGLACGPAGKAAIGSDGMEGALVQQWVTDFGKACPTSQLTVDTSTGGTAADRFTNGGLDAATVDVAMTDGQKAAYGRHCEGGRIAQLPVTVLPVAVVYNVPGAADLVLDAPTLAKIFRGRIQTWNDPAIRALNPGATLPNSPIAVRAPSEASWATFVLTQYLAQAAPADWPYEPGTTWASELPATPGTSASGVPGAVAGTQWSIGFVPLRDAGTLRKAQVRSGDGGDFVAAPTALSVNAAAAAGTIESDGTRLSVKLDHRKPVKYGYPVVGFGYLDFCERGGGAGIVASFASYAVSGPAQATGEGLTYGTLPPAMAQQVQATLLGLRSP